MNDCTSIELVEVFPWDKNFETGNETIDSQHKKLVFLLNEFSYTITQGKSVDIDTAFDQLLDYASYHFKTEEKIWADYFGDDEWFDTHKETHDSFVPMVKKLKQDYKHSSQDQQLEDIIKFLIRWLAFHIIDDDKRMSMVVNELKNGKSLEEAKMMSAQVMNGSVRIFIQTILSMYEGMTAKTLELLREQNARKKAELELNDAVEKLQELSITDELTGLNNRREFDNVLSCEMSRSKRVKTYFTLMLIDIDYFKNINDNYGHDVGDNVLIKMGECLNHLCKRSSDFAFRVGGDEFAVITTSHDESEGLQLAQNVQDAINALKIENAIASTDSYMTVSVGLVSKILNQDETIHTIYKESDQKLYKAKHEGRNKIEH